MCTLDGQHGNCCSAMRFCVEYYLLRDAHPPVGIDVSALQLGFHSLPHTDRIRVPLLDGYNTASSRFRAA